MTLGYDHLNCKNEEKNGKRKRKKEGSKGEKRKGRMRGEQRRREEGRGDVFTLRCKRKINIRFQRLDADIYVEGITKPVYLCFLLLLTQLYSLDKVK